jgi:hypothetical protein
MATVFGFGIGTQFYRGGLSLGRPVATAATNIGQTSFTANWDAFPDAVNYYLDVSTSPTFATFVLQNQVIDAPTTSFNVTGLTACTTYYYRVRAEVGSSTFALDFSQSQNSGYYSTYYL